MKFPHTDASDARIRKAYRDGEPIDQVAKEMNASRDVVFRRARVLGLKHQRTITPRNVTECACGDHVFAVASKGFTVMVSPEDAAALDTKWRCHVDKKYGYVTVLSCAGGKEILGRRIMRPSPGMEVDHKNGITVDNRRSNLRVCTHAENMRNRRMKPRDLPVGVSASGSRYRAEIGCDGVRYVLGTFDTVQEAGEAYTTAAKRLHGEYARAA